MKNQFRFFKRQSGIYYIVDTQTGKHTSLKTCDKTEAQKLTLACNDAANESVLNLALARVYLMGADPNLRTRTWQTVMDFIVKGHKEETARRWQVAIDDKSLDSIRDLRVIETRPEHFMKVLADGLPSTNAYLRRIHNFALDMEWLLKSVLPKRLWPKPVPKEKRGITDDEHRRIIEAENAAARRNQGSRNSDEPHYHERRDFYELLWHIGASQSDAAFLCAENINWSTCTISYTRCKLARHDRARVKPAVFRFGQEVADILRRRPQTGPLFPYLRRVRPGDRATEFKQRCQGLNIHGVTLHSYRYGWAERALACGYPQRFAQQALGHNSKAVHHAYSKNAEVIVPSLADWQAHWQKAQQWIEPPKPIVPPIVPQPQQEAIRLQLPGDC